MRRESRRLKSLPSVTRRPFLNSALIPSLSSHVLISGPPPCTSTGLTPTQASKTRSLMTPAYRYKAYRKAKPPVQRAHCVTRERRAQPLSHAYLQHGVLHGCTTILDHYCFVSELLQVWQSLRQDRYPVKRRKILGHLQVRNGVVHPQVWQVMYC